MKKTLHLLYSLLLLASCISYTADFDERPYEVIELINGTKVPKIYAEKIERLFSNIIDPGLKSTPGYWLTEWLKKCGDKNYNLSEDLERKAREYLLHPDENNPHACNIICAIFNDINWLEWKNKYPQENFSRYYFELSPEKFKEVGISFPIKDLKKD